MTVGGFITRDKHSDGIGLLNMRERTELLSGHFSISSKPDAGTLIRAGFSLV